MDLLPYIKRNYKWSNYRLETACEEILKQEAKTSWLAFKIRCEFCAKSKI